MLKLVGSMSLTLKGVLLWTMHDFLGYGTVVGVTHQGYVTCPICEPKFKDGHSVEQRKQTYIKTCRWLLKGFPYRLARMVDDFNGKIKTYGKTQ